MFLTKKGRESRLNKSIPLISEYCSAVMLETGTRNSNLRLNGQEVDWSPGVSGLPHPGQPQVPQTPLQTALSCKKIKIRSFLFPSLVTNCKIK